MNLNKIYIKILFNQYDWNNAKDDIALFKERLSQCQRYWQNSKELYSHPLQNGNVRPAERWEDTERVLSSFPQIIKLMETYIETGTKPVYKRQDLFKS